MKQHETCFFIHQFLKNILLQGKQKNKYNMKLIKILVLLTNDDN